VRSRHRLECARRRTKTLSRGHRTNPRIGRRVTVRSAAGKALRRSRHRDPSSDEKADRLKAIGADAVINYRTTPEWHLAVRDLTHGRGVDQVVDIGGGTLERSIQSVALDGQVNFIGRLSNESATINTNTLYNAVATVRVVFAGSRAHFTAMNRAIAANRFKPIIDRVFSFDDVLDAFRYYEAGNAFGKVVISQHRKSGNA
jgi:NADPH:quinone reductase-like Zn-dependent oxidoreductase